MSDGPDVKLGAGAEFDLIRAIAASLGARGRGIGDDAAVIPLYPGMHLVVSTDTSVENVHFRREWLSAEEIGYRAAAAALSDLAAMGAQPLGLLTAMTVPDSWRAEAARVASGVGDAAADAGGSVYGGDLTAGSALSLSVTVLGWAAQPVARSGARAGDSVYVTGRLGGPASTLAGWSRGQQPAADARARFARPTPRIREARWLAERRTSAMIDISDGLIADLGHVAAASGVAIQVDAASIPRFADADWRTAAGSGEEYELALTAPAVLDAGAFERAFGVALTVIGKVVEQPAGEVSVVLDGARVDPPRGHDHFLR